MPEKISQFFGRVVEFFGNNLLGALAEIRIVDVIDILILAVILFWIYKFIRQRRAGRLAVGLLFFIAAMVAANLFNLRAMQYIFRNFYQVGLIAIIIIFQSDLRAVLERVGSSPMRTLKTFTDNDYKAVLELADTVAAVCDSLSRTRTGGLIVIERDTKLGDYMGQGVILNAEPSQMLLRNLFFNKAPLHDGAVIIRARRVYAAGCYLPLSSADVNKDLGTRHRAAIGLSEVSDAFVIVVSEETGTISIATAGTLVSNYNYSSLKQEIVNALIPEDVLARRQNSGKEKKKKRSGGRK